MKSVSTIKELAICGGFGAIAAFAGLALNLPGIMITGVPLTGIIPVAAVFFALLSLIVRKFGAVTIAAGVYSLIAIPTVLFGPPGVYKLFLGIILGLLFDSLLMAFRYSRTGYYVAAAVSYATVVPATYLALLFLGFPAAERLARFVPYLMIWYVIAVIATVWLTMLIYEKKLKNLKVVKQLQE
ncbi:hypothetical protein HYU15_03645 [Candidatus Woesearchaeota archaeon]|nr:hypothetical protein [Candidatus Woesearchaeota archaeon]